MFLLVSSPEENHRVVERTHSQVRVLVLIHVQAARDGVAEAPHVKVPPVQDLKSKEHPLKPTQL